MKRGPKEATRARSKRAWKQQSIEMERRTQRLAAMCPHFGLRQCPAARSRRRIRPGLVQLSASSTGLGPMCASNVPERPSVNAAQGRAGLGSGIHLGCDGNVRTEAENGRRKSATQKLPTSCSPRAVPKVAHNDTGGLRNYPKAAQPSPNRFRTVAPRVELRPNFGQNWPRWAKVWRRWPSLTNIWQISTTSGRCWP